MSVKSEDSAEDDLSSQSSSSSSSEDEEDPVEPFEKDFFKTLSYLKAKDPAIYDSNVKFFTNPGPNEAGESTSTKKKKDKSKPMYLKDFERSLITERKGILSDDEDEGTARPTYVDVQKDIQKNLKKVLEEGESDEDDSFGGFLTKRQKTSKEEEKEEEDYIQWLKGQKEEVNDEGVTQDLKSLHDYWNNPDLDKNEGFLKDFILNKRFLDAEEPESDLEDESDLSEDGRAIEAQEKFEHRYNMRFEEPEDLVKRYPRTVEGSLRRKDDKRTRKRAEIRERKKAEKLKKREVIKKAQKQKMKEIEEKLEELKKLVGNDELGFSKEDILEDFDPEKFDKKMGELYNDDFYAAEDNSKPEATENLDDEAWCNDAGTEDCPDDDAVAYQDVEFNMDCEADLHKKESRKKETRTKKKKNRKKSAFTDIASVVKPVYDPSVHESFQKYMDDFYSLDCEDFIDDLPCRFKYRSVEPNDFGLSVEEVLMADDKELNKWSSIKKILKKRPTHIEKNEVKIYQMKAKDENLKRKLLPSLFEADEVAEKEDEGESSSGTLPKVKTEPRQGTDSTQGTSEASSVVQKKKKKNKLLDKSNGHDISVVGKGITKKKNSLNQFKPKMKKFSKQGAEYSDNRLRAYGIKPKKFRRK